MRTLDKNSVSDDVVLATLGERIARYRLQRNQTQSEVAFEAGVSRRSIYKLENGQVVDTRVLIRVLRALGLLSRLDALIPEPEPSPVALLEARGKDRVRASGRRGKRPIPEAPASGNWTWPDDNS